ncbi:Phage late control gene D protein (GPD) [Anaeromicropila populeti]|uniref:Phage late control gene D protein (GPD) n=2 Tax=Anaeromicropila populeti TaxID=37658 RepID=A0A1I6IMF3_9FIRM|nr:Phage late control gene D protein (GPD) [Anaeromicropila populeti]
MVTTFGEIKISCFDEIEVLTEFKISQQPNKHPRAQFRGILKEDANVDEIKSRSQDILIQVIAEYKSGKELRLFVGYIEKFEIEVLDSETNELSVELIGTSCKLDQEWKNRSFQDVSKTHEDIMNKVLGIPVRWNTEQSRRIQMPVIQYNETDWQFLRRLSSIYEQPVIVNEKTNTYFLDVGSSLEQSGISLNHKFYKQGISKKYYELGGKTAGMSKKDFMYYEICCKEDASLGQTVVFKETTLVICKKTTELIDGELIYQYRLAGKNYSKVTRKFNDYFIGHTILGEVIETEAETLKLSLKLEDDEHLDDVAYPYQWTPETGNLVYCMPQIGTTVSLYFSDNDESSGKVVNCIRKNGTSSPKMGNTSNKHFTTEDGMLMDLNMDTINFATTEDENGLSFSNLNLVDKLGIYMETAGDFTLVADKKIEFHASCFFVGAFKGEIQLVGSLSTIAASFWMHYQFDAAGRKSYMRFTQTEFYSMIQDAPVPGVKKEVKKKSFWDIVGKVALGAVAVVAATAVVVGAVALCCTGVGVGVLVGIAAAGVASGGFTIGVMAYEECQSGADYSVQDYMKRGAAQAFIGAVTQALGVGALSKLGKASKIGKMRPLTQVLIKDSVGGTIDFAGNMTSTIVDNRMAGYAWDVDLREAAFASAATYGLFDSHVIKYGGNQLKNAAGKAITKNLPGCTKLMQNVGSKSKKLIEKIPGISQLGKYMDDGAEKAAKKDLARKEVGNAKKALKEAPTEKQIKSGEEALEKAKKSKRIAEQNRNKIVKKNKKKGKAGKKAIRQANNAQAEAKSAYKATRDGLQDMNSSRELAKESLSTAKSNVKKLSVPAGYCAITHTNELIYNFIKVDNRNENKLAFSRGEAVGAIDGYMKRFDYIKDMFEDESSWGTE